MVRGTGAVRFAVLAGSFLLLNLLYLPDHIIGLQITRITHFRHLLSLSPSVVALKLRLLVAVVRDLTLQDLVQLLVRVRGEVDRRLRAGVRLRLHLTVVGQLVEGDADLLVALVGSAMLVEFGWLLLTVHHLVLAGDVGADGDARVVNNLMRAAISKLNKVRPRQFSLALLIRRLRCCFPLVKLRIMHLLISTG